MVLSRQVLLTWEQQGRCAQQRSDRMFQSSHHKKSHCINPDGTRVAHFGSKFLSTQKIEGSFDVRNVTKPTVAVGQVTDRGQGVWLNDDGEFVLDVKSARKIEKLLELRKQKGVHVTPCEEQSSNLFPLVEQESSQGRQMDRGELEVQEERQARVKSAPVLPTDRERDEDDVTHATFRSWCEVCESSVPLVAMDYGFLGRDTDAELATILMLIQRPHGAVGASQRSRASCSRLCAGIS